MSETHAPGEEPARDVLAAEAFAMPAPDPDLHRGPIVLPDDPTGIAEPHDVLAAEEFPMPAARGARGVGGLAGRANSSGAALALGALAVFALWSLLRIWRRR
jgi:hypothetical protein